MKYLTITCNNAFNYGAVLQTYALYTYLQNLGHDGKVINYKPDYLYKAKTSNPIKRIIRPIIRYPDFKKAILILSAVPCASVLLNMAEIHHQEEELAANCVLVSTLLCFITIPVVTLLLNIF